MIDTTTVIGLCTQHGFALAGVAPANKTKWATHFESWIHQGKQGEMQWLENNVSTRLDPSVLLEGAASIICVADRYGCTEETDLHHRHGRVARYARGNDYHKEMKRRLHHVCDALRELDGESSFRACVDTAPLLEREHAAAAGLGSIGKHTLLIEQGVGSWLLLGAIVTTANLDPTQHGGDFDPCGSCTCCIDACPTDAITPWSVDATACISYLTIEHRSSIDPKWHTSIGEWLFGCDICQEVCPHNQMTKRTTSAETHAAYQNRTPSLDVLDVLNWTEDDRREHFRGSPMKRAKLDMIRRNAAIVARNLLSKTDDLELREKLQSILDDENESEIVRMAAGSTDSGKKPIHP